MCFDDVFFPQSGAQWLVRDVETGVRREKAIVARAAACFSLSVDHQSLFLRALTLPQIDADVLVIHFVTWHPERPERKEIPPLSLPLGWFYLVQDKQQPRLVIHVFLNRGFQLLFASPSTTSSSLNSLFKVLLQLSFAVLVRYRSSVGIFSLGWSLPPALGLHSQTTRLVESTSWSS